MERIGINLGSILVLAFVFYFVIKGAVKNGINESYLFSQKQRNDLEYEELEETFRKVGHEMPDFLKEYYDKDKGN